MVKKHFPELSDSFYLTSVYFFLLLNKYIKINKHIWYYFIIFFLSIHRWMSSSPCWPNSDGGYFWTVGFWWTLTFFFAFFWVAVIFSIQRRSSLHKSSPWLKSSFKIQISLFYFLIWTFNGCDSVKSKLIMNVIFQTIKKLKNQSFSVV